MEDVDKDRAQLINELERSRQRIAELEASETRYRAILNNADEIIVVIQDNVSKYSNPKSAELTGYSQEELTSRPFLEFVHPDDRQIAVENYSMRLKGDWTTPGKPVRIVGKDKSVRWIEFSDSEVIWEGKPALLYVANDVTEWKNMEQALKENEAKYKELADSITDVFFGMDNMLRYTYWNKASEELTGVPAEEALGKSIYDIFPDDEATAKAVEIYRSVLATKEPQHFVNETSLGGRDYVFDISAYPTQEGLCVYVKDITEQKKLERSLDESEQWYRHLFDNAPFGIGFSSLDGKVVTMNKAMGDINGYSFEEMSRINMADIYADKADREILLQELRRHGSVVNHQLRLKRKDGTEYDAIVTARLATIGDKEFVLTILNDVTEQKRAEESLRLSEQNFRDSIENSPLGIRIVSEEGKTLYANKALLSICGYHNLEELSAMPRNQLYTPESYVEHRERVKKRKAGEYVPPNYEITIMRKDGQIRNLSVSRGEVLWNGERQFQVVYHDITERKTMEQEYQTIIGTTIDGFWQADMQGRFLDVNDSYCNLIGYSRDELLNMSISDVEAVENPEETAKRIQSIGKVGHDRFETRHRRKDGRIVDVEVSVNYLPVHGGRMIVFIRDITERKRAGEQYQTIIRTAMDGFMIVDLQEHILDVNDAYCNLIGYSRDELMNMSIVDIEAMMKPEEITESFRKIEKIKHARFETYHRCKDGRIVDVEVSINYLPTEGGRQFVFIHDITERKRAEEELRSSEERYRLLAENASDVIWTMDMNLKMNYISPSCVNLHGYTPEESLNRTLEDGLTRESLDRVIKIFAEGLADETTGRARAGRHRSFEAEFIHKDGSTVWTETVVAFIRDEAGKAVGVLGATRNIDERKRAEEAIRESEERYRLLAENVRDVIWSVDTDLRFTYISPSVRYLGYRTPEELMSMSFRELLTPSSQKLALDVFTEEMERAKLVSPDPGRSRTIEVEFIRRDNSIIWAELKMSFMRDNDGKPVGILGVMRDISERKEAELERRALEQKAQFASRLASVGELSAGIAHEINNPLTGVIGYAELLMQEDVPEKIRDDLKIIHEGANRVADIVRGLLTFARQTKPERTTVDINQVIEVALRLRAYELVTNNIKVTTSLAPDLPFTVADAGQLQQVFLNLIINAETEMRLARGKGKLEIRTEQIDDTIRILFRDDGPGIDLENLERIFDPFFTTRVEGKGTGLGLSICHGIVTEHGGRIYVESKLGHGATFIIELPIVGEKKRPKHVKPERVKESITGAKILVVDDEPVVRQLLSQVLAEDGHEVETTDDGKDALSKIRSNGYSLILMDMKLPGISGSELYKRLQKVLPSVAKRVVFITGDVMSADTESFLTKTKLPYIAKPFDVHNLSAEINRLLARHLPRSTRQGKERKPKVKRKRGV